MTTPFFTVSTTGLTATVDAVSPIVEGVKSYFTDPNRGYVDPPGVFAGEWSTFDRTKVGPPGAVVIGPGTYQRVGSGVKATRYAPGAAVSLDADHIAPIVGVRLQTFNVWIWGFTEQGQNFQTTDPTEYALAQQVAAFALSDVTWAALREIHGHDIEPGLCKPLAAEQRGEATFGYALAEVFGPIPIPIFGDVISLEQAQQLQLTILAPPATTGDLVEVS